MSKLLKSRKSKKSRRRRSRKKSIKQLRADCRKQKKVYDTKTKRCREPKPRGRPKKGTKKSSRRRKSVWGGNMGDESRSHRDYTKVRTRRKSRRGRSRKKALSQLRADCRKQKKVYDPKMGRCRARKKPVRHRGSKRRSHRSKRKSLARRSTAFVKECLRCDAPVMLDQAYLDALYDAYMASPLIETPLTVYDATPCKEVIARLR